MVYPWHRNGSLNTDYSTAADPVRSAMLDKKKLSNLRYSYNSYYYSLLEIWEAEELGDTVKTGISGAVLVNSEDRILTKIPAPKKFFFKGFKLLW